MKADGTTYATSPCEIGYAVSVIDLLNAGIVLMRTPRGTVVIPTGGCPPGLIRAVTVYGKNIGDFQQWENLVPPATTSGRERERWIKTMVQRM
eukprot:12396193-Heterocapsa_arctica.AAC.1